MVEVYHAVGKIMSRFTAGKVPKAFKVIPNLQNWEEILFLTDPEHWSPHAVYQATRLFISNLNAKMVCLAPLLCMEVLLLQDSRSCWELLNARESACCSASLHFPSAA